VERLELTRNEGIAAPILVSKLRADFLHNVELDGSRGFTKDSINPANTDGFFVGS
jgi:hypothetical protein